MVYVFLAAGFEETEAIAPIDCLRRAGQDVKTVGIGGKVITGSHGIPVTADLTEDEISLDDALAMAVLPGGMPGTLNLKASDTVQRTLAFCAENDRFIGAICAAPTVLGAAGLLKGRRAVCFPGCEDGLTGADVQTDAVCRDGKIITSRGAGTALDFGLALVAALCGTDAAQALAAKMVYRQ